MRYKRNLKKLQAKKRSIKKDKMMRILKQHNPNQTKKVILKLHNQIKQTYAKNNTVNKNILGTKQTKYDYARIIYIMLLFTLYKDG